MKSFFLKLWKDDDGAEMVEWAIVVGLVVLAAIGGYALLGSTVSQVTNKIASSLSNAVK
jgi:Flp pilus assembly pilin Flp